MSIYGRRGGGRQGHRSGTVFVNAVQTITGVKSFTQGAMRFFGLTEDYPTILQAQDSNVATATVKLPATSGTLALLTDIGESYSPIPQTTVAGSAIHTTTMSVNTFYIANNSALETFTLPSTKSDGDEVAVQGAGAGGWKIAQNAADQIRLGVNTTIAGLLGYLYSNNQYDFVQLKWSTTLSQWRVIASQGNIGGH